jgi:hypothetical protein
MNQDPTEIDLIARIPTDPMTVVILADYYEERDRGHDSERARLLRLGFARGWEFQAPTRGNPPDAPTLRDALVTGIRLSHDDFLAEVESIAQAFGDIVIRITDKEPHEIANSLNYFWLSDQTQWPHIQNKISYRLIALAWRSSQRQDCICTERAVYDIAREHAQDILPWMCRALMADMMGWPEPEWPSVRPSVNEAIPIPFDEAIISTPVIYGELAPLSRSEALFVSRVPTLDINTLFGSSSDAGNDASATVAERSFREQIFERERQRLFEIDRAIFTRSIDEPGERPTEPALPPADSPVEPRQSDRETRDDIHSPD